MGGGMEANKNKWIEEWGSARENLEHNFRWTRRNFAIIGIFGIAVPILVYKGIVRDFEALLPSQKDGPISYVKRELDIFCGKEHMQDEDAGRPYRKFGI